MNYQPIFRSFLSFILISFFSFQAFSAEELGGEKKEGLNISKIIFGHIADSHEWHFFSIEHEGKPATEVAIPFPVIAYSPTKGLSLFSASHFDAWTDKDQIALSNSYEGYHLERGMKEKLLADDGSKVYDLSLTKNVISMFIAVILMLVLMTKAAKKYTVNGVMTAPTGFQNALEPVITFVRDDVAKPNLGHTYAKYMPLLLTLFFFIWINNLLGLLPGGANFTGNIAVTVCLALVYFVVMLFNSGKHFWGHLLNPPGVPLGIKFLLVPIELISLLIKPISLAIRLFANMLAGHIIILCVISMIFIFGGLNKFVGIGFVPVSLAFSVFMFMLELLVAAIQAFIFCTLTAVFIGQAIEEGHDDGLAHHTAENEISL